MKHYIARINRSLTRTGLIMGLVLSLLVSVALSASAALLPPVQFFYVPLPEQSTRDYMASVNTARTTNSTVRSVISIVSTGANTVIYYDQWEDGYELDLANPVQASTRIWGDSNTANGNAADVCAACVGDTLNAGNVIALLNDVPLPRNSSNLFYDGRDYLGATKAVAVSRSEWATTPGTVLAGAVEVYDVSRFGTNFTIPVGENLASNQMFELTALMIMADKTGTVVQIDKDGNGSIDLTVTLNKGENYKVASGVYAGATVTASKPVQVHLLTADVGSSYETRWLTIYPINEWSSSYFAPVGTTDAADPADVWVYNPGPAAISVKYDTLSGSGTLAVAGNTAVRLQMPANSGGHFYTTNGANFFAIGTVDADQSGTDNQTHDWGYSLVPESSLTTVAVVGWGPGSDDQDATLGPDQNGSPIWVMTAKAARVYVDYDGDPATGALTDSNGNKYDVHYDLAALQSKTVYDNNDKDQTGMRLYTLNGVKLTAAWGQDPATAGPGNPYLDMGTTILPLPVPEVKKEAGISIDVNSNGVADPGDTLVYTVTVTNKGAVILGNVIISDTVPAETTYVANSTKLNGGPIADNGSPTIYPLDQGGVNVGSITVGNTAQVVFKVQINTPVTAGVTKIFNTATVDTDQGPFIVYIETPLQMPTSCSVDFTNAAWASVVVYQVNGMVYVQLTDGDQDISAGPDIIHVEVVNQNNGDREDIPLTETGNNTGIFRGSVPSSNSIGLNVEDGTVHAKAGQTLGVNYIDPINGDTCADTAVMAFPSQIKPLYLDNASESQTICTNGMQVKSAQKISDLDGNFLATLVDGDMLGARVSDIGDLNGDGLSELAVGVRYSDIGGTDRGAIYVLFMNPDRSGKVQSYVALSEGLANLPVGFLSEPGGVTSTHWGSVEPIGDLNGDGVPDLITGVMNNHAISGGQIGAAIVIFMDADGTAHDTQAPVVITNGSGDMPAASYPTAALFGWDVEGIGDLNGDGVKDIAVVALNDSTGGTNNMGSVNIIFLDADGTVKNPGTSNVVRITNGSGGMPAGTLVDNGRIGSVAAIGDVNGDGVADLAISQSYNGAGKVYILFMDADGTLDDTTPLQEISTTAGGLGVALDVDDRFGGSISSLGDIDGNGVQDLLVSAYSDDDGGTNRGALYIVPLNANGTVNSATGVTKISATTGNFPYALDDDDLFGYGVDAIGDFNQDGVVDVLIGVAYDDDGGANRGAAYVANLSCVASQSLDRVDPVGSGDSTTALSSVLSVSSATVALDAVTTSTVANATSHSVAHTTTSSANRLMLVGVSMNRETSSTSDQVNAITYSGQSLTRLGFQEDNGSGEARMEIWALTNPPAGNANVVLTFSRANIDGAVIGIATFTGVHQTTPYGSFFSNRGTGSAQTLSVTSAAGELVFDTVSLRSADFGASGSPGTGQTQRWKTYYNSRVGAGGSTKPGATSVTMAWTSASSVDWSLGAVSIKPAPAGVTSTTFTQTLSMASPFTMPVGGPLTVTTYISGSLGANGTKIVTATLRNNGTTFATLTNPTYNSAAGTLVWTGALAANTTVAAGQAVSLTVTSGETNPFQLRYDSLTYPSKIDLPTTTVINVNTLAVYDAAYAGGTTIVGGNNGQTAYIRTTISDPFGASDILSATLKIQDACANPPVTVVMTSTRVVASTAGTKTYEYPWATPSSCQGTYQITVTAHEGYEGITDSATTPFALSFLDLGTPSTTEFTSGNNGPGTELYAPNVQVCLRTTDSDQNTNPLAVETISVIVTSVTGGDSETVLLTETGIDTGVFSACIPANASTNPGTGTLYAPPGDNLTVSYTDPNDPGDTSGDTAVVTTLTPQLAINKTLVTPVDGTAVVSETVQFNLVVSNPGPTIITTVVLTDTFPSSCLSFQSASITPNSVVTPTLKWNNIGPLAANGGSQTLSVFFTATAACAPATNSATASGTDAFSTPVGPVTKTANVTTTRPQVAIAKTLLSPNPGPATIGDPISFRINITNTGSTVINLLPLSDEYSASCMTFVNATPSADGSGGGSAVWNNRGPLGVGASTSVVVNFTATGPCTPAVNTALVDGAVDVNGDHVPSVQATASLVTQALPPQLAISKRLTDPTSGTARVGNVLTYTILITNTGPNAITSLVLTDTYDSGFLTLKTWSPITPTHNTPGQVGWNTFIPSQPPLLPGQTMTVTLGFTATAITAATTNVITTTGVDQFGQAVGPLSSQANVKIDPAFTPATLSGTVWNDLNGNGSWQSGEPPIASGVVITLSNGLTTTTDMNGVYTFTVNAAGIYTITEGNPVGFTSTGDVDGGNPDSIQVTVTDGAVITGRDFFDAQPGALIGTVFYDLNGNGTGTTGMAGITVTLSTGAVTTTDVNGVYTFTNLMPGSYTITETNPAGYASTKDVQGSLTDDTIVAAVTSGTTTTGQNFWDQPPATAALGDLVWNDLNKDGIKTANEPGIPGAKVIVTGYGGDGILGTADDTVITATTDINGIYTVTNRLPDTYHVLVDILTLPEGFESVLGPDDKTVSLAIGETKLDVDFPYYFAGKNNLGDYVWRDTSGNGNWTDEGTQFSNGINGVTVTLYLDDGDGIFDPGSGGDLLLVTTVTTNTGGSGTGFYNFLIPAVTTPQTYWVAPTGAPLAGLVLTSGTLFGDAPMLVTNTGTANTTVDFGYAQPVTVSGGVYNDPLANKSGTTGLAGVVITATLSGGSPITTTTNASGLYTFTNLVPGSYSIVEGTPVGYESTGDVDGANDDTINLVLTSGNNVSGQNFWDRPGGSIGDFVWYDTNGNGVQDGGEPGISGVVISLTNSVGAVITVTTNASGLYSFTELLPGVYTVTVASGTPSGSVGTVGAGSKTSPYVLTLAANQDVTDADFGYDSPSNYVISKTRQGLDNIRTNAEVSYTIRITNTGQSWLTTVPLSDSFDSRLLQYFSASVPPAGNLFQSPLLWTDVTTSLGDVAPGGTISLTVTFITLRDTTLIAGGVATNTVTAVNPLADPDGPGGPLGNLEVLASQTATATVTVLGPTNVSVINTHVRPLAQADATQVEVTWETVSEVNVVGFHLVRLGPGEAVTKLIDQPILAGKSGQAEGMVYDFMDTTAIHGQSYTYMLQIILSDGQIENHRLGTVQWMRQIFLPLVVR